MRDKIITILITLVLFSATVFGQRYNIVKALPGIGIVYNNDSIILNKTTIRELHLILKIKDTSNPEVFMMTMWDGYDPVTMESTSGSEFNRDVEFKSITFEFADKTDKDNLKLRRIKIKQHKNSINCGNPLIDSISGIQYYLVVDSVPEYPGGHNEMLKFIMANFKYPNTSDACCIIYVSFIIDTFGNMVNLKIERSLQEDFDNEILRVMRLMPKWIPGKCYGKPVNVKITLPLRIGLQ